MKQAHMQTCIWKWALEKINQNLTHAVKYVWIREEKSKSLQPTTVPANVKLAPENILNWSGARVQVWIHTKHQDVAVILQNWHDILSIFIHNE